MLTTNKIEKLISVLLAFGIWISASIVVIGLITYLVQHGEQPASFYLLKDAHHVSIAQVWHLAFSLSPTGLIELGLLLLVATQLLRVALLTWFYYSERDNWFTFFSLFILLMLIYSFAWRH